MKCEYCPSFECKLKSDYKRHILTKLHIANEKKIIEKENELKEKEIKKDYYHHDYVMWCWKMRYILVDLRDLKGLEYKSIKTKTKSMILKFN